MDFSGAFSWMNIRFLLEGLKVTVEVSLILYGIFHYY